MQAPTLKNENTILFLLSSIMFTHIMDFMIIMPLGEQIMKAFKVTPLQFSIIVSAYTISAGFFSFVASFLIDRFDRKKALVFAYTGFTIGTLLCAFAPSYIGFVALRVFAGAFGGSLNALIYSVVGDYIPYERRGKAMGRVMTAFAVASALGVPFGLILANTFQWQAPFIFLGLAGILIGLAVFIWVPALNMHLKAGTDKPAPTQTLKNVVKYGNQQAGLLFVFLLVMGQFTIIPFIAPYMEVNVGFNKDQVALIYFLGGVATFFGLPVIGKLADKYGKHKVFVTSAALSIFPIVWLTNMGVTPFYIAIFGNILFFIFVTGRMTPANAMMTAVVRPENRGGFMSLTSAAQQLSAGISAFIAGNIIYQQDVFSKYENYNYIGYIAIGATILAMFLSYRLKNIEKEL